jgi:hypothetical protein
MAKAAKKISSRIFVIVAFTYEEETSFDGYNDASRGSDENG